MSDIFKLSINVGKDIQSIVEDIKTGLEAQESEDQVFKKEKEKLNGTVNKIKELAAILKAEDSVSGEPQEIIDNNQRIIELLEEQKNYCRRNGQYIKADEIRFKIMELEDINKMIRLNSIINVGNISKEIETNNVLANAELIHEAIKNRIGQKTAMDITLDTVKLLADVAILASEVAKMM